jgi:hypothetical protein
MIYAIAAMLFAGMFLMLLAVCRAFARHHRAPEAYEQRLWAKYALPAKTQKAA